VEASQLGNCIILQKRPQEMSDATPPQPTTAAAPAAAGGSQRKRARANNQPAASGSNAANTNAAPVLTMYVISATLKCVKKSGRAIGQMELKQAYLRACHAATAHFESTVLPAWVAERKIQRALIATEIGSKERNAHLQTAWMYLSAAPTADGAVQELKAALRDVVAPFDEESVLQWKVSDIHEHSDVRDLFGYCYKDHRKDTFRMASRGMPSPDYLESALAYAKSNRAKESLDGQGLEKFGRPAAHKEEHIITRTSLVPNAEQYETFNSFQALNLTVEKLTALDLESGRSTLHPHFVAGQHSQLQPANVLNAYMLLRRNPAAAGNVNLVKLVLHGEHWQDNEPALNQLMVEHGNGLSPAVTDRLTFAQAQTAVRTGVVPNSGILLQGSLRGYCGQALVVDALGDSTSMETARALTGYGFLTTTAIAPVGRSGTGAYLSAAAARMLHTDPHPFAASTHDVLNRLTHQQLIPSLNRLLGRTSLDAANDNLTESDLEALVHQAPQDGDELTQPWLARRVTSGDAINGSTLVVLPAGLHAEVQSSLNTFVDGPPQVHVRIVETDYGSRFTIAWQVSLTRMHSLAPAPATHAPQPNTAARAPVAPAGTRAGPVLPPATHHAPAPEMMDRGGSSHQPIAPTRAPAAAPSCGAIFARARAHSE
jgi:hypothetical protein